VRLNGIAKLLVTCDVRNLASEKTILANGGVFEKTESPMRILVLIARQCDILLQVKKMKNRGVSSKEMAGAVGVPVFALNKYTHRRGNLNPPYLWERS